MSKVDDLLIAFQENVGEWTCGYCNSGSNQPAATFREIKKRGYKFEETSPNRWGKSVWCDKCNADRSHYKLLTLEPVFDEKPRMTWSYATAKHIIKLFDNKDAITGASISSTPEIDHKVPWTRLKQDVNANEMDDEEIIKHFQLLTREHNLLKDRACGKCIGTNKRPQFLGLNFYYEGDDDYKGSCIGCGWNNPVKWKLELSKRHL